MTARRTDAPRGGALVWPVHVVPWSGGSRPAGGRVAGARVDTLAETTRLPVAARPATAPREVAALHALPAVQRRALLMRHVREMTPEEIAAREHVSPEVVTGRLCLLYTSDAADE